MKDQLLDTLELERERGITIKSQSVKVMYKAKDGQKYQLNIIDTPGHVDFSYEVSRSLAACDGALLIADAAQGVEAQTLANAYLAIENDLEIIPIINKIDLPSADIENVKYQIENVVGLDAEEAVLVSAKTGEGVEDVLEAIVAKIPEPKGDSESPLKALIFDSNFDNYRGVVVYIRLFDGTLKAGDKVKFMSTGELFDVDEVGVMTPKLLKTEGLTAGEVGYMIASIKDIRKVRVGDTITGSRECCEQALPGYKPVHPMVFSGIYPVYSEDYEELRDAIEKLTLNDPAIFSEPENSMALGLGFRCGFLGPLHMEIFQERLEREYNVSLIITSPSVAYEVERRDESIEEIDSPAKLPPTQEIHTIREPFIKGIIMTPDKYVGDIISLCMKKRGTQKDMRYVSENRVVLEYEMPLSEVVIDFYGRLKTVSQGYASFDYEMIGYQKSDLVKMDILINGDPVDALSLIVHRSKAEFRGRSLISRMKKVIPRQLFEVAIQAAVGSRVISRVSVKALRKNVTAKCYGGDISRKRKLLEKQKEGKKRMKRVGRVEIPQDAFMAVLEIDKD